MQLANKQIGWRCVVVAAVLGPPTVATASDALSENTQLAIVVRQLDMADRLAEQSAALIPGADARYRFDYNQLHADIARMRSGIQAYLTPRRSQPRHPNALVEASQAVEAMP